MQLFHTPRTGKIPQKGKYFTGTLRSKSSLCFVRLSFSVQRCHMCVRVVSYTPAAVCFCVCVCSEHTPAALVTVCRLALSVRSMNGKHSQLCESPISNWVGLPGWSCPPSHPCPYRSIFPSPFLPTGSNTISGSFFLGRWNRSRLEVSYSLNYESRILMPGYFSTPCECYSKCVSLVPPASILVL